MKEQENQSLIIGIVAFVVIGTIIIFFYCRSLHKLVSNIAPENRSIEPQQVWFQMIPILHIIYPFIILPEIIKSARKELIGQGQKLKGDQGLTAALLYPAIRFPSFIPIIGIVFSIISLIFFGIFWAKVSGPIKQIEINKGVNLLDT